MQTLTNEQIIAKHHPARQAEATIELAIVEKLIETAESAQCKLEVWPVGEGAEYNEVSGAPGAPYDVKTALFDLDDAQVYVVNAEGVDLGWVRLVFGNGSALVSDYTTRLESFLRPVLDFADGLE